MPQSSHHEENLAAIEPLRLPETFPGRNEFIDLVIDLAKKSAAFKHQLPPWTVAALADIVRSMNCYYSNLIEGHNTHPIDIEKALKQDYSHDNQKRNLQLEAKAHIEVQKWIDEGGLPQHPTTALSLREIHRRFFINVPEELHWIENPANKEKIRVIPGQFRSTLVEVGKHLPPSPPDIPRFLNRFAEAYSKLGETETILAAAAAHHRLLWIHPFLDGNGRVARLMTYAMLLKPLESGGLWSIARGLARKSNEYKLYLAACDLSRRNDHDGRGNLSQEELLKFTRFFLDICLDQVEFMQKLMNPVELKNRIILWAKEEEAMKKLPPKTIRIIEAILYAGELPRSEIPGILEISERQARRITGNLLEQGIIFAATERTPFRLAFPARLAGRWLPGLFPDQIPD